MKCISLLFIFFIFSKLDINDFIFHGAVAYAAILIITFVRSFLIDKYGIRLKGKVTNFSLLEGHTFSDTNDSISGIKFHNECEILFDDQYGKEKTVFLNTLNKKRVGDSINLIIPPSGKPVKEDHPMRIYQTPIILFMVLILSFIFFGIAFCFA